MIIYNMKRKINFLLLIACIPITFIKSQPFNILNGTPFPGVNYSSIAFADIDGDADMDLFISGQVTSNQKISKLYKNNGYGIFTEVLNTPFPGIAYSSVAFADIDGDADMDLLITGDTTNDFSIGLPITRLYANDGNGNFSEIQGTPFQGVSNSIVVFEDIDGDSDMDLLISGNQMYSMPFSGETELFTNDGNGNFTKVQYTLFQGVIEPSIEFADIDGDGDKDLLIAGIIPISYPPGQLYEFQFYLNDGDGEFTPSSNIPFIETFKPKIGFADVDGDSDLDLLVTGVNTFSYSFKNVLFKNDGNGNFTADINTPFYDIYSENFAFNDIDGDNDLDVLMIGISTYSAASEIYINDGSGVFSVDSQNTIGYLENSSIAFADIDGDTDHDLLITGNNFNNQRTTKMYVNGTLNTGSINIAESIDIQIAPNPTQNKLFISSINPLRKLIIYDSTGRFVLQKKCYDRKEVIDVSKLNSGVYWIEIHHEMNKPIIKQFLISGKQ